ncbi:42547_t:CDS:2, partial [Gigaspora margarita]
MPLLKKFNPSTSEDTSTKIEEQNSRYDQTPKIIKMMSEVQIEVNNTQIQTDPILLDQGTNTFRGSYTQIEENRNQIVNAMGIVLAQGSTLEQKARTIKQSSEQYSQPKSYSEIVRRLSITGHE